ncbi:MAG: hypothetical protein GC171_13930 [Terrimonas sp.]|nr:hypothetical protein [Terrimonas sp.]
MNWHEITKDYLRFSKKERVGIISILSLTFLIWFSPSLFGVRQAGNPITEADTAWFSAIDKQVLPLREPGVDFTSEEEPGQPGGLVSTEKSDRPSNTELFYFDPNSLSATEWERLGLRKNTINTIRHYLAKGGHFYQPEDLKRIYGLRENEYDRLRPYIRITATEKQKWPGSEKDENRAIPIERPEKIPLDRMDINTADSLTLETLPGIGPILAARIIRFREKLGGFNAIEQVGETYGLADTVFQKIRPFLSISQPYLQKININTVDVEHLQAHPYISRNLAKAIIAYRNQHQDFQTLEELKKIEIIDEMLFNKLMPYLVVK